jgi:hypothetical protein
MGEFTRGSRSQLRLGELEILRLWRSPMPSGELVSEFRDSRPELHPE